MVENEERRDDAEIICKAFRTEFWGWKIYKNIPERDYNVGKSSILYPFGVFYNKTVENIPERDYYR